MGSSIVILGAGTGGLTAAYSLLKQGIDVTLIEKEPYVGGLMRPIVHQDFMVDYGYKHLYYRIPEVHQLWTEILGEEYLPYELRTGILYKGHLMETNKSHRGVRRGMPLPLLLSSFMDLLKSYKLRKKEQHTLQDFAYAKRGAKFVQIFSQGFDERFKGINWADLKAPACQAKSSSADFIKDAIKNNPKSNTYYHPAKGSGQITDKLHAEIKRLGGRIYQGYETKNISSENNRIKSITISNGQEQIDLKTSEVISSLPVQVMAPLMGIVHSPSKKDNSDRRGVMLVYLFLNTPIKFPHTFIKVSCPNTKMSRITNYNSYGGTMVPKGKGCICIEYYTTNARELFEMEDDEVYSFTLKECEESNLLDSQDCQHFEIIRNATADPATSWEDYAPDSNKLSIYNTLSQYKNLYSINRSGTDKSTYAGLMAAKAIVNKTRKDFDLLTSPNQPTPWMS